MRADVHARRTATAMSKRLASGVPGIVIALYRDTTPLFVHVAGVAQLEKRERMRADRLHPIASVTKQFAAVAVLTLVEAGQVALDAPVERCGAPLPASPPSWRPARALPTSTPTTSRSVVSSNT